MPPDSFPPDSARKAAALRVELHVLGVGRHDHLHEVFGDAVAALALNKHFVDVAVVKIADRPFDQIAFFIDLRRGDGFQRQFADLLPQALQIFVVALDLGLGAFGTRGAHNQTSTLGTSISFAISLSFLRSRRW